MTCKAKDMYVIMGSTNYKQDKPLNICATKIRGEWLVGYNRWKKIHVLLVLVIKSFTAKNIFVYALA